MVIHMVDWVYFQSDWTDENWRERAKGFGGGFANAKVYDVTVEAPYRIHIKKVVCLNECIFHKLMADWSKGVFNRCV